MSEKNDIDLIDTNNLLKKEADVFLYELGLHEFIKKHGDYYIAGSYDYDLMVWRDLDLYVSSSKVSLSSIYDLISEINKAFKPFWFMGKQDTASDSSDCYFIGFETKILNNVVWNFDIWFFSEYELDKQRNYTKWLKDGLNKNPEYQKIILEIKSDIYKNSDYGSKYFSIDLYKSVIEGNVKNSDEFYAWYDNCKK